MPLDTKSYRYYWRTKQQHKDRYGDAVRIVSKAPGNPDTVLVEFEDGLRATCHRACIRWRD